MPTPLPGQACACARGWEGGWGGYGRSHRGVAATHTVRAVRQRAATNGVPGAQKGAAKAPPIAWGPGQRQAPEVQGLEMGYDVLQIEMSRARDMASKHGG